ncbi:MAG: LytR C-terminal domain-containing protein [Gemmatimonadaceae bacterium]|nr:LytR C-terminal domain-containing protein [Gemmatimonadaceae bacterium]
MTSGMPSWPGEGPAVPSRARRGGLLVAIVVLLVAIAGGWWWLRDDAATAAPSGDGPATTSPVAALGDTSAQAPAGTRIVVRVINATSVRGLARRATLWLRDFGYDVVDFDSAPKLARTETLIEVHTGHEAWGERVRKALGVGRVSARPDTSRYVDLTVFIGSDWQPPTEPLRP